MVWRIPILDDVIDWVGDLFKGKKKKNKQAAGPQGMPGQQGGVPSRPPQPGSILPPRAPLNPETYAPIAAPPNPMAAFGQQQAGGGFAPPAPGTGASQFDERLSMIEERLSMINDKLDLVQREIKSMFDQFGGSPWK